jgi:chromosome segregation ATPase
VAIKTLELENFRAHESVKYELHQRTMIRGQNGTGKSTIKEALAFIFCGTDSLGGKNPQHLIRSQSDDKAIMRGKMVTDRAEIERSLSKKGNSTIKIIREGVPTTVTQTQLQGMLGNIDVVLSAMVPGYFLGLSSDRQSKALADILPPVDREALFEELAGFPLSKEEVLRYGFTRRFDLIASAVAQDRRGLEQEQARKEGSLGTLQSVKEVPEPQEPAEIADLSRLNALSREWEDYERQMRDYSNQKVRSERIADENYRKEERRKEIKKQLEGLKEAKPYKVDDVSKAVAELQDQKKSLPSTPSCLDLPSGDHCPSCGQVVGVKHREKVAAQNEAAKAEYEKVKQEVIVFNNDIQEKIEAIYSKENAQKLEAEKIEKANQSVRQKKKQLEIELAGLIPEELPDAIKEPTPPSEEFDPDVRDAAMDKVADFEASKREYARYLETKEKAQAESNELMSSIDRIAEEVDHLRAIEKTLKEMPEAEMKKQAELLKMPHVNFEITDRIEVSRESVPYGILSTGYQMRSDIEICLKFNELMKRPLNVIFIDNVDLIDKLNFTKDSPIQWFVAKVDDGCEQVVVEEF